MLYYPFVQPPRDVLAQGVLYWDRVGSIVPGHYDLPEYLRAVAGAGIYQPIKVDSYFRDIELDALASEVDHMLRTMSPGELVIPPDPMTHTTRLYYGKLPMILEELLVNRGVIADQGSAFQGTHQLLGPLLALLARSVADAEPDPTVTWVCHTDTDNASKVAFEGSRRDGVPAWRLKMGEVFKVPLAGTPLAELLEFRRKHDDERVELLRAVDKFVDTIGGPDAPDLLPRISEEVEYAVREIEAAAQGRGLKLIKAAAYGTIAAGTGAAATAATMFSPLPEAASAGVFGVLGSLLTGATSTYLKPEVNSPYNYLHTARRQFAAP